MGELVKISRLLLQNWDLYPKVSAARYRILTRQPKRVFTEAESDSLAGHENSMKKSAPRIRELRYSGADMTVDPASRKFVQRWAKDRADDSGHAKRSTTRREVSGPSSDSDKAFVKWSHSQNVHVANIERRTATLTKPTDRNIRFSKMGDGPETVKFIQDMMRVKSKGGREKSGKLFLEGKRLITDALLAGLKVHQICFTDADALNDLPIIDGECKVAKISRERLYTWTEVDTPQGVFAVVDHPNPSHILEKRDEATVLPLTVVCDHVQDPGNMGVIIRIVAAVGAHKILLTTGCADPWEQKVLRSGMGAHFRVPIYQQLRWPEISNYLPSSTQVYLAESNFVTPTGADSELPLVPYYDVKFFGEHVVLIIGGETESLSPAACELAKELGGMRVHIPMSAGVDSLNAGTALGILAFEVKRQLEFARRQQA